MVRATTSMATTRSGVWSLLAGSRTMRVRNATAPVSGGGTSTGAGSFDAKVVLPERADKDEDTLCLPAFDVLLADGGGNNLCVVHPHHRCE